MPGSRYCQIGDSIEEAIAHLKEATQLYLEEFPLEKERRSLITNLKVHIGAVGATT